MGMFKGSDIFYIGLAAGAAYLIYRLAKPLTETTSAVGGSVADIGSSVAGVVGTTEKSASGIIQTAGVGGSTILSEGTESLKLFQDIPQSFLTTIGQAVADFGSIITTGTAQLKTAAQDVFSKSTSTATKTSTSTQPVAASYVPKAGVDYTAQPPNYTTISGQEIYVPPPKNQTYASAAKTTASEMVTTQSASSTTSKPLIGAPVGYVFPGGAVVKSSGASGKYPVY